MKNVRKEMGELKDDAREAIFKEIGSSKVIPTSSHPNP